MKTEMKLSVIICTYQRPHAIEKLMDSILKQTRYPDEIIIVDGSFDDKTKNLFKAKSYPHTSYFQVGDKNRGLTRQRNFGIKKVNPNHQVVAFLDDDVILYEDYFEKLLSNYFDDKVGGVGGYIVNESKGWIKTKNKKKFNYFYMDGFARRLSIRFLLRKLLGLFPDKPPGFMPDFSHGLPTSFLPPTGKTYPVEFLKGASFSFRYEILKKINFSEYFVGYGLYEDMDFSLRASKLKKLFVNTAAKLNHYHEPSGRPDYYKYGRMVVRNGWYVWRVKYPHPSLKARFKWNITTLLLATLRLFNIFSKKKRQGALSEAMGRYFALLELIWNKPKVSR